MSAHLTILHLLEAVQNKVIKLIGDTVHACNLLSLLHYGAVGDLSLFYSYFFNSTFDNSRSTIRSWSHMHSFTVQLQSPEYFSSIAHSSSNYLDCGSMWLLMFDIPLSSTLTIYFSDHHYGLMFKVFHCKKKKNFVLESECDFD